MSEVIVGIGVVAIVLAFSWHGQPRFIHSRGIVRTGEDEQTILRFYFRDTMYRVPNLEVIDQLREECGSTEILECACWGCDASSPACVDDGYHGCVTHEAVKRCTLCR